MLNQFRFFKISVKVCSVCVIPEYIHELCVLTLFTLSVNLRSCLIGVQLLNIGVYLLPSIHLQPFTSSGGPTLCKVNKCFVPLIVEAVHGTY